ncbi:hypothetical protein [Sphaerochaeta sp. PS]|uniref:hypothetical protein n=1 Tax=Sphaerochaeta sp. PS TaxID=3076336 RepID=UPI0028A561E1|nr:hypothetical protein [Sphaerochaeta sp. PS]MDT4761626.1 hypothetical protein [Sphaerochaeta sp. PS]
MERIVIQKYRVLNKETFKNYSTQTGGICQLSYPFARQYELQRKADGLVMIDVLYHGKDIQDIGLETPTK